MGIMLQRELELEIKHIRRGVERGGVIARSLGSLTDSNVVLIPKFSQQAGAGLITFTSLDDKSVRWD